MGYPQQTTSQSQCSLGFVTITHPYHPLFRHQVEITRIRRGADPDLIVKLPDGFHAAIAASWTDYAGANLEIVPRPPPFLDLEGLRQMAQFVGQIRQQESGSDKNYGAVKDNIDQVVINRQNSTPSSIQDEGECQ